MAANEDFDQSWHFDDRASDDRTPGPARAVESSGRCMNCWGPVAGRRDGDGRWIRIECRLCGRSVDGEDAHREAEDMRAEVTANLPLARVGRGSQYREDATFVLKILPDMDRDKQQVDHRVAASMAAKPKGAWLTRQEIPPGAAGYLYGQARAFLSGLENQPREMSAISLSDFEFGEPQVVVQESPADTSMRVYAKVPARHRQPSDREVMARMGTTMVAGMAAAFSCEVGMKAILMTRLDKAKKTHDLLELYHGLPSDSRERLEADFPEIAAALARDRATFGEWRYFEQKVGEKAFVALVNADRVRGLGKAARVIVDECVVVGLVFQGQIDATFYPVVDRGTENLSERIHLRVDAGEAAIPWPEVLVSGVPPEEDPG